MATVLLFDGRIVTPILKDRFFRGSVWHYTLFCFQVKTEIASVLLWTVILGFLYRMILGAMRLKTKAALLHVAMNILNANHNNRHFLKINTTLTRISFMAESDGNILFVFFQLAAVAHLRRNQARRDHGGTKQKSEPNWPIAAGFVVHSTHNRNRER